MALGLGGSPIEDYLGKLRRKLTLDLAGGDASEPFHDVGHSGFAVDQHLGVGFRV